MTSKPTVAMIAAAGRPYTVAFGGRYQFQYAGDVAETVIAAARADRRGAGVQLRRAAIGVDEIVRIIGELEPSSRGGITFEERSLPFPEAFDGGPMEAALGALQRTPLAEGIAETISCYRAAIRDGRVDNAFLDRVLAG